MNKKILVPLGKYDRSEDMIPYIMEVAKPGMTVIFLVRYPIDGLRCPKEEIGRRAALETKELVRYYSWQTNVETANARIAHACEVLRANGIEAVADVYTGSLKRTIRRYAVHADVHSIMTRAGVLQRIAGFLNGTNSFFDLLKRATVSPVLLIHPGMVV
jgi:hypothetical protein